MRFGCLGFGFLEFWFLEFLDGYEVVGLLCSGCYAFWVGLGEFWWL